VTALALAAGAALTMSACSAGQITQTSTQVAAINGSNVDAGAIALRNVHVIYPNSEEYSIEPGGTAQLGFTIVNLDPYVGDALTGISTDFAASVTGAEFEIPPQSSVIAGASESTADLVEQVDESSQAGDTEETPAPASASIETVELVNLSEGVRPGLTIPVTFSFAEAGDVVLSVPIDAGPELPRDESELSPIVGEAH
jgi:acyl-CoA synthetase (AMP-forming)/AMP-acid ligase II